MCKYIFTGGGKTTECFVWIIGLKRENVVKDKDKKSEKHRGGIKVRDKN